MSLNYYGLRKQNSQYQLAVEHKYQLSNITLDARQEIYFLLLFISEEI